MTNEARTNPEEVDTSRVHSSDEELDLANENDPVIPVGMTSAEAREFREKAAELIVQLEQASGSKEMELTDSVGALGVQAQRHAGAELELLRARVGDMIMRDGSGATISQDLVDLRLVLDQINPHDLRRSIVRRMIYALPLVKPMSRTVQRIAIRYETVSKQVRIIETRLRDGRAMLARDNIELRKLYEQVEAQQTVILKNAYLGELLMQQLEGILDRSDESPKAVRLREALHEVSIRVQAHPVHAAMFAKVVEHREGA